MIRPTAVALNALPRGVLNHSGSVGSLIVARLVVPVDAFALTVAGPSTYSVGHTHPESLWQANLEPRRQRIRHRSSQDVIPDPGTGRLPAIY